MTLLFANQLIFYKLVAGKNKFSKKVISDIRLYCMDNVNEIKAGILVGYRVGNPVIILLLFIFKDKVKLGLLSKKPVT